MTIKIYPQHYNADATATCGDCEHQCRAGNCEPISDPDMRLCSGDPLPAGECPECGSLAYVADRFFTLTAQQRERLAAIRDRIRTFGEESEAQGHTDIGEVWEILGEAYEAIDWLFTPTKEPKEGGQCDK